MQTNIDITKAFLETPNGVLSIHQISKKLNLPYGTAYNRVHQLYEAGIIQMIQQGKAKLCALNPENDMTASILALGGAQETEKFIKSNNLSGNLLKKIRKVILENCRDLIYSAIILTPDMLAFAAEPETYNSSDKFSEIDTSSPITLDFLYIQASSNFDESKFETAISSLMQPGYDIRITSMTVDRDTMLGMFNENENNAGIAAYKMLQNGLVLYGYENFYSLILEAFTSKLSMSSYD